MSNNRIAMSDEYIDALYPKREYTMMTTYEVANLLSISYNNLARLARQGKIPGAVKVGMLWRFNRSKIYDWVGVDA